MNRFYTSDAHLFHDLVGRERGFEDGTEWAGAFATMYCDMVAPRDHVWFLGDMTGGGRIEAMLELVGSLPGVKHLVTGNHDPVGPHNRKGYTKMRRYLEVFESVSPYQRTRIAGRNVMLSHYPYEGDHTDQDRYTQFRLRNRGLPLLHGHTHDPAPFNISYSYNNIHVGLDAHDLRLVTEEWVELELAHIPLDESRWQ